MQPARIAELLSPFLGGNSESDQEKCHSEANQSSAEETASLSAAQLQSIATYIDLLNRWNSRLNLTSIRDSEQIVTRHFGESLFAARHLFPSASGEGSAYTYQPAPTVADIGSGAGFPGIPIKLWQPDAALTLIESNHKKAAFLRELVRTLQLPNVTVIADRAETLATPSFDVVTLRAVDRMQDLLPTVGRLLAPKARLVLFLTSPQAAFARSALPLIWAPEIRIPQSDSRLLLIGAEPDQ